MLLAGYQMVKNIRENTWNALVEVFRRYLRLHNALK